MSKEADPQNVKNGNHALKVTIENAQYWDELNLGRNDVFYPVSTNAHWDLSDLIDVRFSVKPSENAGLLVDTNPVVRLYKNGGNRIEFVPRDNGVYTNLFSNDALRGTDGWYDFDIPLSGDAIWEKNVIGYIDPGLPQAEHEAAKARLEQEILADVSYVEISIRSTTSRTLAPYDVLSYYIDGRKLRSHLVHRTTTEAAP